MELDWWTRGIAIYGAVLSTTGGIFQIYRERRNNARLKVAWDYYDGERATPFSGAIEPYHRLIVTNTGRQPITLEALRIFDKHGGKSHPLNQRFERTIKTEPTEETVLRFDLPGYVSIIKRITVLDTEGCECRISDETGHALG